MSEIRFCTPTGKYWFLSPLSAFPITMSVDGKDYTFPSVEHYYQAMKFYASDERFTTIINLRNPDDARLLTKTPEYKINRRADFDKNKFAVMEAGLRARYAQNPEACEMLKSTGNAILIKSCPTCYQCGFGEGSGENRIGKTLMQIRQELLLDNFADDRDKKLLENDKYTFSILRRIIGNNPELLLTDHRRMIICYTCAPYPVWIWTPDDLSEAEMENVYQIVKDNSLLDGNHRFNLKYELAEYFIKRAEEDSPKLSIITNMFAYDCLNPIKPKNIAKGQLHRCAMKDLEELVKFLDMFHQEIGIDQKNQAGYRIDAEDNISSGNMFFWQDENGNNVASCKYAPIDDTASINLVFTMPEHRRRHYAENLVYQVTMEAKRNGYIPMLYTDADYIASNACYEKIGYTLRGKLCTIG